MPGLWAPDDSNRRLKEENGVPIDYWFEEMTPIGD